MDSIFKENFLKLNGWFFMNGQWHHPNLTTKMDLASAYLYESFKHQDDDDSHLFDDDAGADV